MTDLKAIQERAEKASRLVSVVMDKGEWPPYVYPDVWEFMGAVADGLDGIPMLLKALAEANTLLKEAADKMSRDWCGHSDESCSNHECREYTQKEPCFLCRLTVYLTPCARRGSDS